MTENKQEVDQITKEPDVKEHVKDPKKVEAGRRLAQYHKKAKQALKKENDPENNSTAKEDNNDSNWMPEMSLTTALSLVGIGLTSLDLYFRWRKSNDNTPKPKSNIDSEVIERPITKPKMVKTTPEQSRIPKKIGME